MKSENLIRSIYSLFSESNRELLLSLLLLSIIINLHAQNNEVVRVNNNGMKLLATIVYDGLPYAVYNDHAELIRYDNEVYTCPCKIIPDSIPFTYQYQYSIVVPVTRIGDKALYGNCIDTIILPITITWIGEMAFSNSRKNRFIKIPDNVRVINGNAFSNCKSLEEVILPQDLDSIKQYAFYSNPRLTNIDLPNSVRYVGQHAFEGCGISSLLLSENVTKIDNSGFKDCRNLCTLILPNSLEEISDNAFENCWIDKVILPKDLCRLGEKAFFNNKNLNDVSINPGLLVINSYAFGNCRKLTNILIPEGVNIIATGAFSGCENVRVISIPSSVTQIDNLAFENVVPNKVIYNSANPLNFDSYDIFGPEAYESATLYVYESVIDKIRDLSPWKYFKNILTIDDEGNCVNLSDYHKNEEVVYYSLKGVPLSSSYKGVCIEKFGNQSHVIVKNSVK